MLDLKQLSDEEVVVLYHRLYQTTGTIFDNYWAREDAHYPLAKDLDKKLTQAMWSKIAEEVKERKICLETHTITIKLGN